MEMRTPYHSIYEKLNAPIIDFGGWGVASHITSPDAEYLMIRNSVGFAEYHFQSCFGVCGPEAFDFIQRIIVNDLGKIKPGGTLYSSILDDQARLIDDVIVFWMKEDRFIIHGGITREASRKWIAEKSEGKKVWVTELSNTFLSIQGPKSINVLQKAVDIADLEHNRLTQLDFEGVPVTIARVGFSGELGYEVHFGPEYASGMWERFTRYCAEYGGGPFGLMAAFPIAVDKGFLFGSDFYAGGSPLEYGLGWSVAFDKGFFHGRDEMLRRKETGLQTKLVGIEADETGHAITGGLQLAHNGKTVGATTNGWVSPVLKRNLGRAWIAVEFAKAGTELQVESESGPRTVKVKESYRFFDPKSERVRVNPRDML
ncbi:aminomethyltransferase family protein [Mesorhizobium sophorae]|uniref:aminomethyltransferase family protein n=1 Tax=Mesorhizobium sophorae TaxID=1300294 RepID=UPI000BA31713|nr:aminomethyltransferase family protein [Mesorhizobium sophorae]